MFLDWAQLAQTGMSATQESRFTAVLTASELPLHEPVGVSVGDRRVCLVRLEDGVYGFDDRCPHRGGSLSRGSICGSVITCAFHTWQFDVRTGELVRLRAPDRLALVEIRERNGVVEVALPE
jgi:nitrite reductase/ring-hydroxylating ferredoxin subunit